MAAEHVSATFAGPGAFWNSLGTNAVAFAKISGKPIAWVMGPQVLMGSAAATGVGLVAFGSGERRVTPLPFDPILMPGEYGAHRADPDIYMANNYRFSLFITSTEKNHGGVTGHLGQVNASDGSIAFIRRIPASLRDALMDPAVLAASYGNLYVEDGRLYAKEEIQGDRGTLAVKAVELRPPFRNEPFRDANLTVEHAAGSNWHSFSYRGAATFGPIDGWSSSIAGELTNDRPYKVPVASTFRVGMGENFLKENLPNWVFSPCAGVRQQNTRVLKRASLSAMFLDLGGRGYEDLTYSKNPRNNSRTTLFRQNVSAFVGSRDRVRADWDSGLNGFYIRSRIHALAEGGISSDIYRYEKSDRTITAPGLGPDGLTNPAESSGTKVVSVSAYDDAGIYPLDLRLQGTAAGGKAPTEGSGVFNGLFSLVSLDPGVQAVTTGKVKPITDQGGIFAEDTTWKAERARVGEDPRPAQARPSNLFPLNMPRNRWLGLDGDGRAQVEIEYDRDGHYVAVGADQNVYQLPQEVAKASDGSLAREATRAWLERQWAAGNLSPITTGPQARARS